LAYASKLGRARISARSPQAAAVCGRCGGVFNHVDLQWQFDFAGAGLINKRLLVCHRCLDTPQHQLRAIVLPADPMPVKNPRVQIYQDAESNTRVTSGQNTVNARTGIPVPGGDTRVTQSGATRVEQQTGEPPGGLNQTPGIDPAAPGATNPGLPYDNLTVPNTGPLK
jgi:hypothetical protein